MEAQRGSWLKTYEAVDPGFHAPRSHATTLVETQHGLLLAFFGGEANEGQHIWTLRRGAHGWGPAQRVVASEEWTDSCWNPVLHRTPGGAILLFYKQGPNCSTWRGMLLRSDDDGHTWSEPHALPVGIWGPIRNKPLVLSDRSLLCPSSTELGEWRVHFERTDDSGRTWTSTGSIEEPEPLHAIQPTLIPWPSGRLQALCRSGSDCIVETWSEDEGRSWSPLACTELPNPNSAIDAALLPDGRALLVYNPTLNDMGIPHACRGRLAIAVSEDGKAWLEVKRLEGGDDEEEFSYPAVIVSRDGLVHITYTAGHGWTGLRHLVVDPAEL